MCVPGALAKSDVPAGLSVEAWSGKVHGSTGDEGGVDGLEDDMEKGELGDVMGEIESEFVRVYEFLDSHEETVGGGECYTKVEGFEDVVFPFDDVLLSKLWISWCSSNNIFKRRRIYFFVLHGNQKTAKRHLMQILLLASLLLDDQIDKFASDKVSLGQHSELL